MPLFGKGNSLPTRDPQAAGGGAGALHLTIFARAEDFGEDQAKMLIWESEGFRS